MSITTLRASLKEAGLRRRRVVSVRRLTDRIIADIRRRYRRGELHRDIAKRYGIHPSMVSLIRTGRGS